MGTDDNSKELSRIDYLIISTFLDNNAITPVLGLTIKELNITEVKRSCLWKHLKLLIDFGYVCQSGMYGKQKMYYLTSTGKKVIKED